MADTSSRGLRVIGAGMGRTGTASLKRALEQLGFGPCHHMEEVVKNASEVPTWQAAARGEKIDWATFLGRWGSAVDFPAADYYVELMATFPDAKVILSVRDADSWYRSIEQTIIPALKRFPNSLIAPHLPFVGVPARVMSGTWFRRDVLDRFGERAHVLAKFEEWNERVKRTVPADRLLVFEAKDGWAPLCAFLGVPVPDAPYPRVNDTPEFQRRTNIATVVCWVLLLAPVAAGLGLWSWLT